MKRNPPRTAFAPVAFATVLVLAAGVPTPLAAQRGGVTLYEDDELRGRSETFFEDTADLRSAGFDRRASSVRVDRGCRARLYADVGFQGPWTEVDGESRSLRGTPVGNDGTRSLKVRCGWDAEWGDAVGPAPPRGGYDDEGREPPRGDRPYDRLEGGRVRLYEQAGFLGLSVALEDDVPDLGDTRLGNDRASSVQVARGCRVRLYADAGYRGASVELDGDTPDLARVAFGNRRASSLKVRCGWERDWDDDDSDRGAPGYGGGGHGGPGYGAGGHGGAGYGNRPGGERGVTIFRDRDFRGEGEVFEGDVPDLRGTRIGNDAASSIQVDPGCRVRLFRDAGFRGESIELGHDEHDLGETPVGNDTVSSLVVRCGRRRDWGGHRYRGVTLYQHDRYRGESDELSGDVFDMRDTAVGNDEVSSIRVDRGCRVELFADAGFRGASIVLEHDEPSLGRTPFGNDRVSSLRVRCY